MMIRTLTLAFVVCSLAVSGPAFAKGGDITFAKPETQAPASLSIGSPAFEPGGAMPTRFSSYDDNVSPPLTWGRGPTGTKSYALVVEDPDAPPAQPIVHWTVWDIPADATGLPQGASTSPPAALADIRQGRNSHGEAGYYGPHPPKDDPPHRYFFQLFALDTAPALPAGSELPALVSAMKGHILARGEMFGTFGRPANPKNP